MGLFRTRVAGKNVSVNSAKSSLKRSDAAPSNATPNPTQFELVFRTDPTIYDGRFANNGWLQELPKPLSKLTWDNAALVSPNTAQQLGLDKNDRQKGRRHLRRHAQDHSSGTHDISDAVPTWITPGQPDGVITIHLGYGRRRAGRVGNGHGFNAYEIRTADSPWSAPVCRLRKPASQYLLAVTQLHFNLEDHNFSKEDRDMLRSQTLEEYLKGNATQATDARARAETTRSTIPITITRTRAMGNYAWGMAIDLNNCVGCNACTIACQSENNIPIVGKEASGSQSRDALDSRRHLFQRRRRQQS